MQDGFLSCQDTSFFNYFKAAKLKQHAMQYCPVAVSEVSTYYCVPPPLFHLLRNSLVHFPVRCRGFFDFHDFSSEYFDLHCHRCFPLSCSKLYVGFRSQKNELAFKTCTDEFVVMGWFTHKISRLIRFKSQALSGLAPTLRFRALLLQREVIQILRYGPGAVLTLCLHGIRENMNRNNYRISY